MNEEQKTPEGQSEVVESPATDSASETVDTAGVTPSPEEATPAPADPVAASETPVADAKPTEPQATGGKTADEMLFEAALADLGSEEPGRRDTGASNNLTKGERIEAKVIQVEKDRVFVDLGTKAEGVIPLAELTNSSIDTAVGHVQPGDTFEVIVIKTGSAEGSPIVSKKRADFDVQWQKILDSFDAGEIFSANVIERVKGGLVVDIGVRGFVPATHVGSGKLRNIEKFVGEVLNVKIIEVDRDRKKVVLSNRAAEEEKKDEIRQELFSKAKPGDTVEGVVRRLTDYGAFIDLGGIDGLLHISEMSWARIDHPKEVLKEGDDIKVMILKLDEKGGRISLGLRQVLPDPWKLIRENYKQGQKIKLVVNRMVQSGAFLRLPEGAEAFLPLSEISDKRLKKPQEELEQGQEVEPTIIDLRPDERRMVLSLRDGATAQRYDGLGANMRSPRRKGGGKRGGGSAQADTGQRAPTGGATIGERLGMLKGLVRDEDAPAPVVEEAKPKAPEKVAKPAKEEAVAAEEAPKTEAPAAETKPEEKTDSAE